ncbi:hypothetical protein BDA96_10G125100 [Sorghum bicolor]|uniref:DUF7597 domain-containing protein n=2 Tax=Sorghum bicolor TaxID=4558 RepID=A0A921U0K6_SORBI|nr:hypothetical protein BDA96_10G125100 [Sorghum bicolor]OQU76167.1 hypothetical protein SORBI_3010G102432 [Sorghum bicolor]
MAFQRADPNPFKPRGMNILNIPNRPVMVRTMAPRRPVLRNEDLAVLTIHPIPGNPLFFPTVEEVINDFCVDKRVEIKEVQRCHMGQAFVRFQHEFDRDRFVLNSPHLFGGSYFTFVKHNQARNWRSVMFNHECWIMMLGLPEDYYEDDFIDAVLGPFARLISWYKERTAIDSVVVTRLIVKARVVDLEDIPHFSVFTDSLGLNGQSWSVQCEILQSEMLGHHAPGEDDVPQLPEDGGPLLYDFFGLGQQVLAPVAQNGEQVGQHMPQQGDDEHQLPGWGAWQQNNHLHNLNLNLAPVEPANVIQDLNEPPPVEDPMEMIIDPAPDVGQDLVLQIAQPVLAQQPFLPNNQVDEEELQMPAIFPVMQVEEEVMMEEDEIMEQMAQYEQEDDIMEPLAQHEQEMQHNDNLGLHSDQGNSSGEDHMVEARNNGNMAVFNEAMQIGMVRTFFFNAPAPVSPPISMNKSLAPKFLNPDLRDGPNDFEQVRVPKEWAPFLKALIISPAHHEWAKKLICSGLHQYLPTGPLGNCHLSLDKEQQHQPCQLISEELRLVQQIEDAMQTEEHQISPVTKKRGRKGKATIIEDSALRRSPRVKANAKGFKTSCEKNCLACSTGVPTLSSASIIKIGTEICGIKEKELTEQTLMGKVKLQPVGKKPRKNGDAGDSSHGNEGKEEGSSHGTSAQDSSLEERLDMEGGPRMEEGSSGMDKGH